MNDICGTGVYLRRTLLFEVCNFGSQISIAAELYLAVPVFDPTKPCLVIHPMPSAACTGEICVMDHPNNDAPSIPRFT